MPTALAITPTTSNRSRRVRRPSRALAALVALAGAPAAIAQILHVDPPDIQLPTDQPYLLDLNGDGASDFTVLARADGSLQTAGYTVGWIAPPRFYADRLEPGRVIDIEAGWITALCNDSMCFYPTLFAPDAPNCAWRPGEPGLLGVAFPDLNGRIHFGWLGLIPAGDGSPALLLDWACETQPYTPILAGDRGPPCPPVILAGPAPVRAFAGDEVHFAVSADGRDLTYQWTFNGEPLRNGPGVSGADQPVLRLTDVLRFNAGSYAVLVSSSCGDAAPPAVKLDVFADCPPFEGGAYSNDGAGWFQVPDDPALDLGRAATFEAWFRPADGAPAARLISKGDGLDADTDRAVDITFFPDPSGGPGCFAAEFFLGPPYAARNRIGVLSQNILSPRDWNHVAATLDVDAGVCRLYINGVPAGETTTLEDGLTPIPPIDLRNSTYPLIVGATPPFGSYNGRIDEVRVWSVARTAAEIAEFYDQGVAPDSPGLVARYRFDRGPDDATGAHPGAFVGTAHLVRTHPCCPADFNRDEFVDFFDYTDFVACFDGGECPADADPDFNRDGFVDFFDYLDFVTAFEIGCRR